MAVGQRLGPETTMSPPTFSENSSMLFARSTSAPAAITVQLLTQCEGSINTYAAVSDAVKALSDGNEDNRRTMCANGILDSLVRIAVRSRNTQFGTYSSALYY